MVATGTKGQAWAEAIDTIASLDPIRVEALDPAGNVIRAIATTCEEEAEDGGEVVEQDGTVVPASSPESVSRASEDTRLIAFERASSDVAFGRLVDLTNSAFQRLDALEKAYSRSFYDRLKEQAADKGDSGGDLQSLLMAMMGGMAQAQAAKAVNGVAEVVNGAAPKATS
jgi:hypothetical protein